MWVKITISSHFANVFYRFTAGVFPKFSTVKGKRAKIILLNFRSIVCNIYFFAIKSYNQKNNSLFLTNSLAKFNPRPLFYEN